MCRHHLIRLISHEGSDNCSALFEETVRLCSSVSLDFTKLVSVTTDGAPAMTGESNGLVALLMKHQGKQNSTSAGRTWISGIDGVSVENKLLLSNHKDSITANFEVFLKKLMQIMVTLFIAVRYAG